MRNGLRLLRLAGALLVCAAGLVTSLDAQAPGTITTIAGNGAAAFAGDAGPAVQASLNNPVFVAFAGDGGYYIADFGNHRIRRVAADDTISTVAGNGVQDLQRRRRPGSKRFAARPHRRGGRQRRQPLCRRRG